MKDIINPIISGVVLAIVVCVGGMAYNKFEAYEDLLTKLPQVESDLKLVEKAHREMHSAIPKGYTSFKAKTRLKIEILENKKEVNLSRVYKAIKRDSLDLIRVHSRLEVLKNLHKPK